MSEQDGKNQESAKEFEGTTVEEAIQKALEHFNASRDEISVKVVSEEVKGLFGMAGAKPAKIKASRKEKDKNS